MKGGKGSPSEDSTAAGDLYNFLLLSGIGIGLILYLQVLRNRKYWVMMETGFGVVTLVTLPFSDKLIPYYQTTGVNPLVTYMFRLMALARVSQCAAVFLTRQSRDPTVAAAISITNILTRATMIVCGINGILNTKTISKTALQSDIVSLSLLIIADSFHLSKVSTRDGSLTIGDPTSLHLAVDGLLKFTLASWVFGFPDMFLRVVNPAKSPSEGQVALAQVFGCFILGLAVLSFASLCFKNKEDGVNVLKSKLALYGPAVLFGFLNCVWSSDYRGPGHIILLVGVMSVLAFNAGYAVWRQEKPKLY